MDVSFDIEDGSNYILVALSKYDKELLAAVTSDEEVNQLDFYDVSLMRKSGEGYVGYKTLSTITNILLRFMIDNPNVVLCFYCDNKDTVLRTHYEYTPQEYRSRLFSRMFDMSIKRSKTSFLINQCLKFDPTSNPADRQYVHFICRQEHEQLVADISFLLMEDK